MTKKKPEGLAAGHARGNAQRRNAVRAELDQLFATAVELHRQGNTQQAATLYRAILSVDAGRADVLHLLGAIAHGSGDYATACDLIGRAAAIEPRAAQYHFNLGVSLQALQRHAEAAAAYREAVTLQPEHARAHENLGVALQDLGDVAAAADAYRRALAIDPDASIAHQNLGTLLGNLGQTEQAREHFCKVLERHPAYGDAHMKKAWTLLVEGRFAEGWREYEWRWLSDSFIAHNPLRIVPFPRWDGSPLTDKTILINAEQGIGDELMFASCYRDVIAAAEHCVIECDPRLVNLFARSFPEASVLARGSAAHFRWSAEMPAIDYRIPAGSLPHFYRNSLADFPADSAYLRADPMLRAKWRARFDALGKPLTVGISWRGGRETRSSAARSIPLGEWQSLLGFPDAAFVNLQYGDHTEEIAAFESEHGLALHALTGADPMTSLDEFVAAVAALDLVISIDNSTVFMAGATGTPVWALLPSSGEWRWLKERPTSPWFASVTLFRQREPGLAAWREVLRRAAAKLAGERPRKYTPPAPDMATEPASRPTVPGAASSGTDTALFLNDTSSWYHFGCSCTSLAIHAELRKRWGSVESVPIHAITQLAELPTTVDGFDDDEIFARFGARYPSLIAALESASAVYVNGEGALHNVAHQARGLLYLVHIAKTRLRRTIHLINHSCYPDDTVTPSDNAAFALYKKVYTPLDFVAVREALSAELVARMGLAATASFDCLPLFVEQYFRPPAAPARKHVLIAGSVSWGGANAVPALTQYMNRMYAAGYEPKVLVGADAYLAADDFVFVDALRAASGERFELLHTTSPLQWLAAIADAALLVSGRFHHTIAAAFVDTPFIVMESNTPKIAGIMQMLQSQSFVSVREPNLADVLFERSQRYIADAADGGVHEDVKAQLRELARQNFRGPLGARDT